MSKPSENEDLFKSVFGWKNGKPQRFWDEETQCWRCVACGRKDEECVCALEKMMESSV